MPKGKSEDISKDDEKLFRFVVRMHQFEIEISWKRTLIFWGFTVVGFAAYAYCLEHSELFGYSYGAAFLVSLFGIVTSLIWTMINRSNRFWKGYWEDHIKKIDSRIFGGLDSYEIKDWRDYLMKIISLDGIKFSVTRLCIALSDFVVICWFMIAGMTYYVMNGMPIKSAMAGIVSLAPWIIIPFMLWVFYFSQKRESQKSKESKNRPKIFVMGGSHLFKKPNIELLKDVNFDVLMHEGVDSRNSLSLSNIFREPSFMLYYYLWISILKLNSKIFGGDMQTLENLAKQRGKSVQVVDTTLNDLINFVHTPLNYILLSLIFCGFAIYMAYSGSISVISLYLGSFAFWAVILILLFLSFLLYFAYIAWRTMDFRNKIMVKKIISLTKEKNYRNVLFYAGYLHKNGVINLLKNEDVTVKTL
ncbi:hypothetical protein H0N98_00105 [Candidatus Micrarchaeota archaeon]|nr:hypothetical protein [Candidatus Micrarchaeota archaeon]